MTSKGSFQHKPPYDSIIVNTNLKMVDIAITAGDTDGLQHGKSTSAYSSEIPTFVRIDINIDSNY